MLHKSFFIGLALLLIFALARCSGGTEKKKDNKENEQKVTVEELQMGEVIEVMLEPDDEDDYIITTAKWGYGVADWEISRIVVINSEDPKKDFTHAVQVNKVFKIKYIGEKETTGELTEFDFYFDSYDNTTGSEYEIINSNPEDKMYGTFFLYNDSEKWGGAPENIFYTMHDWYDGIRSYAIEEEIAVLEKQQNGREIIFSEVFAEFSIDGKSHRLMLVRYKNTIDGLFKIVLRDHNNNYFTADYLCELYGGEEPEAQWRADLPDEPGQWDILFIGRVAEGLFIVCTWTAPEGRAIEVFVAKDGKLKKCRQAE